MNINDPTSGKISNHGKGFGQLNEEDLERRARELALIDGRSEATPEDREDAREELLGKNIPDTSVDDLDSSGGLSRDPSDPATDSGHQVPNHEGMDEEKALERITLEGVEEAQHDQMVQARRRRE